MGNNISEYETRHELPLFASFVIAVLFFTMQNCQLALGAFRSREKPCVLQKVLLVFHQLDIFVMLN